jgi:N-acetylmuramoyl-L-alanine amidase
MRTGRIKAILAVTLLFAGTGAAQDLTALARFDPAASSIVDTDDGVTLHLALSQSTPWRVRILDQPPRVVLDFREVDWTGIGEMPQTSALVKALHAGTFRPGWSRLVLELSRPMIVTKAGMLTGADTAVEVTLASADSVTFARQAGQPDPDGWALPKATPLPEPATPGQGPLIIVLDPGHGGIDPGAERDGHTEARLMLTFARELKDLLLRDGGAEVILTRDDDVFVPLEARISAARAAGATLLLSLHADSLAEGEAVGATIYTLSAGASDAASQALAERHNRDDLLAGIDLSAQDDLVAGVIMNMARNETAPRTGRLAIALETAIKGADIKMHRHPRQEAGFSVLKSPDIPSVLVELGFLSSAADLKRLTDRDWRAKMALALRDGIRAWAAEDAALRAGRSP